MAEFTYADVALLRYVAASREREGADAVSALRELADRIVEDLPVVTGPFMGITFVDCTFAVTDAAVLDFCGVRLASDDLTAPDTIEIRNRQVAR